jgi:TRAP-type mannitol/chloroaromatic compound transport system permease small subunit
MLNGTFAAMGFAYVHRHQGHIRVDVLYSHLSERKKALIDVLCTFFLFFPLVFVLIFVAADYAATAWIEGEVLIQSFWYPPAGPIRTVVLLALCLFLLQGIAQFIRDLYVLIRDRRYD